MKFSDAISSRLRHWRFFSRSSRSCTSGSASCSGTFPIRTLGLITRRAQRRRPSRGARLGHGKVERPAMRKGSAELNRAPVKGALGVNPSGMAARCPLLLSGNRKVTIVSEESCCDTRVSQHEAIASLDERRVSCDIHSKDWIGRALNPWISLGAGISQNRNLILSYYLILFLKH